MSTILHRKGSAVVTVPSDAMLLAVADTLSAHRVGALVVSDDGRTIDGIVSERDVVAEVARFRTSAVRRCVADFMTRDVTTCRLDTTVEELMAIMTQRRIRHVPVLADGQLAGIVSIGDVVKLRLDELEVHNHSLEQYVTGHV